MGLNAGDVVALTYESTYDGQQIRYALHYRVTIPGSSVSPELDLDAMAQNFSSPGANTMTSVLQAAHVDAFNFDAVVAQRVWPSRTIGMRSLSSFPGLIAQPGLPANVSAVVTKRTLTPGRMGLGSLHLSGQDSTNTTLSEWTLLNTSNNVAAQMLNSRVITGIALTVEPGLFNATFPPTFFSRLFDTIPQKTIRVMRRRTVRLGI